MSFCGRSLYILTLWSQCYGGHRQVHYMLLDVTAGLSESQPSPGNGSCSLLLYLYQFRCLCVATHGDCGWEMCLGGGEVVMGLGRGGGGGGGRVVVVVG